jgi:glycosyltransferase involved in cell wall biosynthesis
MKKIKIFYWSPFLVPIATSKAVINSCYSLNKYSKNSECSIINFFGEFNHLKKEVENKKIQLLNLYKENLKNFLPKYGFFSSRFSFMLIFIFAFFPLKNLIKKEKPDYLIIHLVTSLPLVLLLLFNYETKFILRVSGLPKLNFFRKILWKLVAKKLYCITCPTKKTLELIENYELINKSKLKLLYDPIIEVSNFSKKNINNNSLIVDKNYYFAAGRLTKQKNFLFLCRCFKSILKFFPTEKLLIAGEGEEKKN